MLEKRGGPRAVWLVVAVGVLAPAAGSAQLDITPRIGVYAPVGPLIKEGSIVDSNLSEKRPEAALFLGGQLVFRAERRLSFAATVSYAPSAVAVSDSFGTSDHSGGVFIADARVLFQLAQLKARSTAYFGAGVAFVSRLGQTWRYYSGSTAPAFVPTLGARVPLYGLRVERKPPYPPPGVVMRLEVSDYISRAQFDKGLPTQTTARWHNDVVISFGIGLVRR